MNQYKRIIGEYFNSDDIKVKLSDPTDVKDILDKDDRIIINISPGVHEVNTIPENIFISRQAIIYEYKDYSFIASNIIITNIDKLRSIEYDGYLEMYNDDNYYMNLFIREIYGIMKLFVKYDRLYHIHIYE